MATVQHDAPGQRAGQILRAARTVFLEDGWEHFGVERIAELTDCSRPLVYKHFPCKEEILLALAIESKRRRVRLYERAVMFKGRSRERLVAVAEVETFLMARDLPIELFVASSCLRAKTSQQRQEDLKVLDVRAVSLGAAVVREAISAGDLRLPASISPEDLLFFAWTSRWGAANVIRSDTPLSQAGVANAWNAIELSLAIALDGYGWRPLSSKWDYKETRKRIHDELFPSKWVQEVLSE